ARLGGNRRAAPRQSMRGYAATRGRETVNVEPRPGALVALTEPPWASTIALERYRPSPVPGMGRSRWNRAYFVKRRGTSAGATPYPVSRTRSSTPFAELVTSTSMRPRMGVYLSAFPTRLV